MNENQTLTTSMPSSRQSVIKMESERLVHYIIPQPMDYTNSSEMEKEILNNLENDNNYSPPGGPAANPSISNNTTSPSLGQNSMLKPETSTKKPYISKSAERIRGRNAPISSIFDIEKPKIFEIPKHTLRPKVSQSTDNV